MDEKLFKGLIGESITYNLIDTQIDIYKKIIHDLKIEFNQGKTQIDNLLITSKGIYVIENKNWNGKIVDDQYKNFYQILGKTKNLINNNPIKQNQNHINVLSDLLKKDKSIFKSIIVFGYDTEIELNQLYENHAVINIQYLVSTIRDDILSCEKSVLSHEEIDDLYFYLKSININNNLK